MIGRELGPACLHSVEQRRPGLDRLAGLATAIEDALVPIMTGLIQATGWMR